MAVAVAKHAGARFVVITDINPYRLDLAKKMGATLALDVRSESVEAPCAVVFSIRGARRRTQQYVEYGEVRKRR